MGKQVDNSYSDQPSLQDINFINFRVTNKTVTQTVIRSVLPQVYTP